MSQSPKFYNTRTKQVEPVPIDANISTPDVVTIYSCGPTVYNHAHIGNLSSYIYADMIRRTIWEADLTPLHVMNFTDVDDKTIRDSKKRYPDAEPIQALHDFTRHYEQIFISDMEAVGNDIKMIKFVRATENIATIQDLINDLLANEMAYIADDGIYFNVQKYAECHKYGQLVNLSINNANTKQRINNDEYDKDSAHDFALWKRQKPGEPAWDYRLPDGQEMTGRPGWHIECSAMSTKYLGQPFSIHTGGVDLMFPHHENEIAQSTACADQPDTLAKMFIHNEHLLINGQKMSKSAGNFYCLPDLINRGFNPLDFRMLVLQSHYQNATNFNWEILASARNRRLKWCAVAELRHQVHDSMDVNQYDAIEEAIPAINDHLFNNLATPEALSDLDRLFDLFTPENCSHAALNRLLTYVDETFGLQLKKSTPDISEQAYALIDRRQSARLAKDWTESDRIRDQLAELNIAIQDGVTPIWHQIHQNPQI